MLKTKRNSDPMSTTSAALAEGGATITAILNQPAAKSLQPFTAASVAGATTGSVGAATLGPESLGWRPGVGYGVVPNHDVLPIVPPVSPNVVVPWTHADPELAKQWHFGLIGDFESVWEDFRGAGVHVGIMDSGIQEKHWDLDGNVDQSREITVFGKTYDGDYRPASGPHGTSVAGLIAAERNGEGTVGIAHEASITGINIFDPYAGGGLEQGIFVNADDQTLFFEALRQTANFDVVNHSWGSDTPGYYYGNAIPAAADYAAATVAATTFASDTGRGGLGTISVAAAGNYQLDGHADSYRTDRHFVNVGAYRFDGISSNYSTRGAHLLISAPSDDYVALGGIGVVATDLLGREGYNYRLDPGADLDLTDRFGGTSAAAPMATAVVALMLDAGPQLGWRDVHNILAASAAMPVPFETGPVIGKEPYSDGSYSPILFNDSRFRLAGDDANWNGGAMHYSTDYGFGGIDVHAAVRMAEVWSMFGGAQTSANEQHYSTGLVDVDLTTNKGTLFTYDPAYLETIFDDFVYEPVSVTFEVNSEIDLEHVELLLNYKTGYDFVTARDYYSMASAKFKLIAPDGTEAFVDTVGADSVYDFYGTTQQNYTFGFAGFRGVDATGTWTLQIETPYINSFFDLDSLQLDLYGGVTSVDTVHTYTDEFFEMAAIAGENGRRALIDDDGGSDWLNLAAVTSDVRVSLAENGRTYFDGKGAFALASGTVIEKVVTGDGDDLIQGVGGADLFYGMRGEDTLRGQGGFDTLFGGAGDDVLDGGADSDVLIGGDGDDRALGGIGDDTAVGDAGDDTLEGGDGVDLLVGADGDDKLIGGAGADTLVGGVGDDRYFVDALDLVVENPGEGSDRLYVGADYTLAEGLEIETLLVNVVAGATLSGNGLANRVFGNAGADKLIGGGGNDMLDGAAGDDRLLGGVGSDKLLGNIGADTLDGGDGNDQLDGGADNDRLFGKLGNDTLIGGGGNDKLYGEAGVDQVTGGAGADRFIFAALSDIAGGAKLDRILDFKWGEGDKIDLSGIDAGKAAGDQAFGFIGAGAFTGKAGQLRAVQSGGSFLVSGDIDGNGVADFTFEVVAPTPLIASDFVL